MAETMVIETKGLVKRFGAFEALRGLDLAVPAGSICGFVGRNGAGKTTTIKALLGMLFPTEGTAHVFGLPCSDRDSGVAIRLRTGFVSDEKDLYDFMTVEEMTAFTAGFYPGWRKDLADKYLRSFDLPPNRKVKALSRGMRTKLALLLAFSRGAELLILDEATSGLDPVAQEEVLQAIVGHVARENMTVFFSSHQIAEVEQIADRVALIDKGRLVVSAALDDLRETWRRVQLVFPGDAPQLAFQAPGVERVIRDGRTMSIICSSGAERLVEEAKALHPASIDVTPVSLKEIFLETVVQGAD
jgi:ABC-2 type transport system ATP-binding protein